MGKGFAMRVEREEFQKYEDIDLIALFKVVWVGKWKIIFVTGIAAILSVFYALSLPNIYKSEVLLTTVGASSGGGGQFWRAWRAWRAGKFGWRFIGLQRSR